MYFGVTGGDVPDDAVYLYDAPKGAFVLSVEMDSPAMLAGIQAGDIIISAGTRTITKYSDLVGAITEMSSELETNVVVSRLSQGEYKEISFSVLAKPLNQKED